MADKIVTFIAFGDNHGDLEDPDVSAALVRHINTGFMGRPFDEVICLGDIIDARPARRGASASERGESMLADRDSCISFLRRTRPHILLLGNHDDRLWDLAAKAGCGGGPEADLAKDTKDAIMKTLREVGCRKVYPYHIQDGKHKLGPITFIHGYHSGAAAVRESARTYNCQCLIMGHLHRIHRENVTKESGCVGISVGCIGDISRMDYAKRLPAYLTWGNGWVYGYWNKTTGKWRVFEAISEGGRFNVITQFKGI